MLSGQYQTSYQNIWKTVISCECTISELEPTASFKSDLLYVFQINEENATVYYNIKLSPTGAFVLELPTLSKRRHFLNFSRSAFELPVPALPFEWRQGFRPQSPEFHKFLFSLLSFFLPLSLSFISPFLSFLSQFLLACLLSFLSSSDISTITQAQQQGQGWDNF